MKNAITVKDHATFSASGSKRWLNCAGSINLSKKAPPQKSSSYAEEGTQAHACLESLLRNGNLPSTRKFLAKTYSSEMIGQADFAANIIQDMLDEAKGAELLIETKVDFSFIEPDQFGTLDAAIVQPFGTLTVIDYKYGAGQAVEVENNTQMIYYALCIAHQYGFEHFENVRLVIIQPRAEHRSGPVRQHLMTMEELLEWKHLFKSAVERAKSPKASLSAGEWCRYCPATTICPEISKKAMAQAKIDFNETSGEVALPDVKSIAIPNLGRILSAAEQIEFWIAEVRAHALQVLERSHKVEGWKLVEKRSTRKWLDAKKAEKEAVKKFGKKALSAPELLSPAQLEKAVKESKDWIAKRVSSVSSGTTLAPENDPRPAIVRAQADFEEQPTISKGKENGRTNGH